MSQQDETDCAWAELQEIEKALSAAGVFFDPWKSSMVDINGGLMPTAYWEGGVKGGYVFDNMAPNGNPRKQVGGGKYDDGDSNFVGNKKNESTEYTWNVPSCAVSAGDYKEGTKNATATGKDLAKRARDLYDTWITARLDEIEEKYDTEGKEGVAADTIDSQKEEILDLLYAQRLGNESDTGRIELGSVEDFKERQRFMEQVWLLSRIREFSDIAGKSEFYDYTRKAEGLRNLTVKALDANYPARGSGWMYPVEGNALNFINTSTVSPNSSILRHMINPSSWNHVATKYEFFIIKTEKPDGTAYDPPLEVPVDFNQSEGLYYESIIGDSKDIKEELVQAVGVKNIEWSYKGQNLFTANKDVELQLDLFSINSMTPFFATRTDSSGETYKLIDLAIRHRDGENRQKTPDPVFSQVKMKISYDPDVDSIADGYRGRNEKFLPPGETRTTLAQKMADELKKIGITLYLYPIDHTFDYNENGSVRLIVQYRAVLGEKLLDDRANVLNTEDLEKNRSARRDLLDQAEKLCDDQLVKDLKTEFLKIVGVEKSLGYESILNGLIETGRIYHLFLDPDELLTFTNNPYAITSTPAELSRASDTKLLTEAVDDAQVVIENISNETALARDRALKSLEDRLSTQNANKTFSPDATASYSLQYFFLGDLLDQALENVFKTSDEEFKKSLANFRVVLGDFDIRDPKHGNIYSINIADIPISVGFFVEWFMDRVLKLTEASYSFLDFTKDVINHMIVNVLKSKDYFNTNDFSQETRFAHTILFGKGTLVDGGSTPQDPMERILDRQILDLFNAGTKDPLTTVISDPNFAALTAEQQDEVISDAKELIVAPFNRRVNMANIPADLKPVFQPLTPDGITNMDEMFQFLVIYGTSRIRNKYTNNEDADAINGIMHYRPQQEVGWCKRIVFEKMDGKGLKEARAFGKGRALDGLNQLFEPYKVDVTLFGNPSIMPGQAIYIDPIGLAAILGSPANKSDLSYTLGLGGYHIVNRVKHTIDTQGKFETVITAYWESSGIAGEARDAQGIKVCDPNESGLNTSFERDAKADEIRKELAKMQGQRELVSETENFDAELEAQKIAEKEERREEFDSGTQVRAYTGGMF